MRVILYTTHCPQCKILSKMLDDKGIKYKQVTDVELMKQKGFTAVPQLEIDSKIMNMKEAMQWIKETK